MCSLVTVVRHIWENFGRGVGEALRGGKPESVQTNHHHHVNARGHPPLPLPRATVSCHSIKTHSPHAGSTEEAQPLRSIRLSNNQQPTTMKAVALILALAVITGCNARVVRQADATTRRWEETVNRFWQYVDDLNQKADGVVQDLKASQLTRELDTLITDSMAELTAYRDDITTKLTPYTASSTGQMSQDLQLLANKLQKDMLDAKERSTEYLGELKTMMEQNSDDVRGRIGTYSHKLKKRLNKDTEEIRNTVATYLGEIQSRTSQNFDSMKENVEPYVQQASDSATKKLTDISTILKTQAEGLGEQLETQAEGIKTRLETTVQELRTSLEGKIDELTEMISPYATQIREQVENIMEKVKETAAMS